MSNTEIQKLDNLILDLNFDLCILNSALKDDDGDLELCILSRFVERIYKTSNEIRDIFGESFDLYKYG